MDDHIKSRLYFLSCELKPDLPHYRLMKLLDPIFIELIETGINDSIGSGITNHNQLSQFYISGCSSGIDPSIKEFKSLLSNMILKELIKKYSESKIFAKEYFDLSKKLDNYYSSEDSLFQEERIKFSTKLERYETFTIGFQPLDEVLGNKLTKEIITIIGKSGYGKTSIGLSIASKWKRGSVWFYEPEVSKDTMLYKISKMGVDWDDKDELIIGTYDSSKILDEIIDNPDPNRLIIIDALSKVCGPADNPINRQKYVQMGNDFTKIKGLVGCLIILSQENLSSDTPRMSNTKGASCIVEDTGALIHLEREGSLEGGGTLVTFHCTKNRMGTTGLSKSFSYDYDTCTFNHMMEDY